MANQGVGYTQPAGVAPASSSWMHSTDFRAMLRDIYAKNPDWFKLRNRGYNPDDWDGKPTADEGTLAHRCRDKELFIEAARVRGLDLPKGTPLHPRKGQERWKSYHWETYIDTNPDMLSEDDLNQIRRELEMPKDD